MQRREVLQLLGAAAGLHRFAGATTHTRPLLTRVGLQLYTVRELMARDVEGTLERVAAIGYQEVEFAGYFDRPPRALRATLDRLNLRAPAAHVDPKVLTGDASAVFADAKTLGHEYVIVAWIPEEQRRTIADYQRLAARLNRAADAARREGLRVAYHNHDWEFAPLEGKIPYETLVEETDDRLVRFELDLYWCRKGGRDPLSLFARWPRRFPLVHVKDMSALGTMVDVGAGVIDWKAIVAKQKQAGIEHWIVEHDEPADPIWSATASYRYLTQDS